jgi:hypothetical protein
MLALSALVAHQGLMMTGAGPSGVASLQVALPRLPIAAAAASSQRSSRLAMQEPPFALPYDVPKYEKPFADYEWDPSFPGSFKPGTRKENYDIDTVFEMWEGKDNPAAMELPQDQLWEVPLAPPEDILSWLKRIKLMDEEDEASEEEEDFRTDSLLDDEFDLDDVETEEEGGGFD